MNTIEQERAAYAAGDTVRADLLAQIDDLAQRVAAAEKLLDEVFECVEDDEPPSLSGDWVDQTREFLAGRE
jgi:uncharacterized membrane protein